MYLRFFNVLTFLPLLFSLTGCREKHEYITPVYLPVTESVYASGKIKSLDQYQVFSSVSGIVKTVHISEGDHLKTGAPLFAIINDEQVLRRQNAALDARFSDIGANRDRLADALGQITLAEQKMQNDSALFFRQKNLWAQQVGSRVELEQRQLNYESSKTGLHSAQVNYRELRRQIVFASKQSKKNLDIAISQAADFVLSSKIDGVVYAIYRKKGEQVSPQTPLALIGAGNSFLLEMEVDEDDIVRIKPGQEVLVTMESYKGRVFEARVTKIYPVMDEQSKTITVEAVFVHLPEKLYPNVSFEASIVISTRARALLIPRNYLLNDSLVITSANDTIRVTTGLKDYRMVEITSGMPITDQLLNPRN